MILMYREPDEDIEDEDGHKLPEDWRDDYD